VQVHDHEGEWEMLGSRRNKRLLDPLVQKITVREVGQRLVLRRIFQPLLGAPARAANLCILKRALYGEVKPFKLTLRYIIMSAGFYRVDGPGLAGGIGDEDKGYIQPAVFENRERLESAKMRHRVLGKDDVPGSAG